MCRVIRKLWGKIMNMEPEFNHISIVLNANICFLPMISKIYDHQKYLVYK